MAAVVKQPPPALSNSFKFSESLEELYKRCMKKNPLERATANELLNSVFIKQASVLGQDGFATFLSQLDEDNA